MASLIKVIAVLVAAILTGNWFLAELKDARQKGKPWYSPYVSIPGVLILLGLLLPVFIWLVNK